MLNTPKSMREDDISSMEFVNTIPSLCPNLKKVTLGHRQAERPHSLCTNDEFCDEDRTVYLSICLSVCLSICLSICLSVSPSVCPSVCLSVSLFFCLSICMSVCLPVCLKKVALGHRQAERLHSLCTKHHNFPVISQQFPKFS